jgi:hypothetical protein
VSGNRPEDSPPAPARASSTATSRAAAKDAPPPGVPAYVFTPDQVATARPSPTPPGTASPDAMSSTQRDAAAKDRREGRPRAVPGEIHLAVVTPVHAIATGSILSVDVMASSTSEVVDAPLHLQFDASVLEFVDAAPGDFLTRGGSSVVFLVDGTTRPGDVAIAAGRVERAHGAAGAGLLCRVKFRGIGAGTTPVLVGEAKAWGTRDEALTVDGGRTDIVVQRADR